MEPQSWLLRAIVLLLFPGYLCSQSKAPHADFRTQTFTTAHGLPDNQIFDLTEYKDGFVYVLTRSGITRWDGYTFKTFPANDPGITWNTTSLDLVIRDAHQLAILPGGANYYLTFDTRNGRYARHDFSARKDPLEPITWDNARILYAAKEGRGTAIWEVNGKCQTKLTRLPLCPYELSGFKLIANSLWWFNKGRLHRMDLDSKTISSMDICQPERLTNPSPDVKHFLFGIGPDRVLLCEQSVMKGRADFYLWSPRHNCLQAAGTYINPAADYDFYGLNGSMDSTGHLMLTYYFLGKNGDSRYKNVLYDIRDDRLSEVWTGGMTPNINYPVSVPASKNFRQGFFSLSSNGFTKHTGTGSSIKTLLRDEKDPIAMRGITGDGRGNYWLATDLKGLFHWNSQNNTLRKLAFNPSKLKNPNYQKNLFLDERGFLWSCLSASGFLKIDTSNLHVLEFPTKRIRNFIYHKGLIWFTNETDKLLYLDPQTGISHSIDEKMLRESTSGSTFFHDLKLGKKSGHLLICTSDGLFEYDPDNGALRTYRTDSPLGKNLPTHHFITIHEDDTGIMWIGSSDHGLVRLDPATGDVKVFDTNNGLSNNRVVSILSDGKDRLWLGTFNGLSCFNMKDEIFENLFSEDGLCHTEFNRLSAYRNENGLMFLGTVNGVNIFDPNEVLRARSQVATFPLMTELSYFKKNEGLRTIFFPDKNPIRIGPDNRSLSLKTAAAFPTHERKVKFAYLLEGFSKNWAYLPDGERQIKFEYLPSGDFTLRVKCTTGSGEWSKRELIIPIRVKAFFYQTWWFYLLSLITLSSSAFWAYRLFIRQKLAHQRASDLEELNAMKTNLYTSITHEFRTPLTLILGPVQKLLRRSGTVTTGELTTTLTQVQQNGWRLMSLVNQILDLQKIEANQLAPHYEQGDIMALLHYLTESFHSMADDKQIQLGFTGHPAEFLMDFDKDKIIKIVVNLLTNAIKFTPEGGEVKLTAEGGSAFWLEVKDTGIGISREHQDHIFDLFYQVDNSRTRQGEGSGIGLRLVKEMTELMGGRITLQSEEGKGSCFRIELPVRNDAPVNAGRLPDFDAQLLRATGSVTMMSPEPALTEAAPLVLLIEDNPEVSSYIGSCLNHEFRIEYARDGLSGIAKAIELVPDLVISDVMMPEADGWQVCRTLKQDERTSHIPVILLTALAGIQDKLEGLRRGADAYLAKPFNEEELLITVEKLLQLRIALQKRYARMAIEDRRSVASIVQGEHKTESGFDLPREDAFMDKLISIIKRDLENPELTVEQLNREMAMSNTQLFRKLKALTSLSANQLIRQIRLERARELLKNTNLTIAEIAYQTGFNDPSYFTRIFTKEEGITPKEFRDR